MSSRNPIQGIQVVTNLQRAGFSPIVVVTGYESENIREMLRNTEVFFVHNEQHDEGMGSSIRKAFTSIHGWDAGIIVMGDMPFVPISTLQDIKNAYTVGGHSLVVPSFAGKSGQPVLFSAAYFDQLQACFGDVGARAILQKNGEQIHFVKVEHQAIFWDVDTPENVKLHQDRFKHE